MTAVAGLGRRSALLSVAGLRRHCAPLMAACALFLAVPAARAQQPSGGGLQPVLPPATTSSQFMGSFSSSVTLIPKRESLVAEAEAMRLRFGPLRVRPRLYVGNLGYTNNFYGEADDARSGDFTATVGGGANVLVPVSPTVFLKGSVVPTYIWYADNADRRAFGGTYEASALAYVSRLSFQLTGGAYSSVVNVSSEVEQPVEQSVLQGRLLAQWEVSGRTTLTGDVNLQRRRYGEGGLSAEELATVSSHDGTDTVWSVGVRRRVGARLLVGLSYEQGDLAFVSAGALRDARSRGVLGSAFLDRGRLQTNVYGGYRDFQPTAGSSFTSYSGLSGGATVSYALTRLFSLTLLGRSNLVASLYENNAAFVERRGGATLGVRLKRADLLGAYELGVNDYPAESAQPGGASAKRRDDVQTLRGTLRVKAWKHLRLTIDGSWSRYTSNLPGLDRSVFQLGTTVGLGESGTLEILD